MKTLIELLEFYCGVVFQTIIVGHSLYFFVSSYYKELLFRLNRNLGYKTIEKKLVLIFGIIYILSFSILTIDRLYNGEEYGIKYTDRIFGLYSYAYWIFPLIYVTIIILRQLKMKYEFIAISILSILALIPIETVVMTLALNRDFLPSSAYENSLWFIWLKTLRNYSICLLIYISVIEIIYRIEKNFR